MRRSRVPGDGPLDAEILVCAERPGQVEEQLGRGLVGPSGVEFFGGWRRQEMPKGSGNWRDTYQTGRWERIVGVPRDQVRVENLVRTYKGIPPCDWEIARDAPELLGVLHRMPNLRLVVAMGVHAARWFLDVDYAADLINGVPHHRTLIFGRRVQEVTVIPVVHAAAALRQPETFGEMLSRDLRAVRRCLDGDLAPLSHQRTVPLRILDYRTIAPRHLTGLVIGFDCEGTPDAPEAIQLSWSDEAAVCIYADDPKGLAWAQTVMDGAKTLVAHYAVYDLKVATAMGLQVPDPDDSMLAAFCCGIGGRAEEGGGRAAEPQAIKDLAYRLLGYDLPEYKDLVTPVDDARCREALVFGRDAMQMMLAEYEREFIARLQRSGVTKITKKALAEHRRRPKIAGIIKRLRSVETALKNPEPKVRKRWAGSTVLGQITQPAEVSWRDLPDETREPYACADPWLARTLHLHHFGPEMQRRGTARVYRVTKGILPLIARMETVGMAIDVPGLRRFSAKLELQYFRTCAELSELVGREINPRASEDVSTLLFDELYVEATKLTKSGKHYTTDDKFLKARKSALGAETAAHQAIALILQGRGVWKGKSTYADAILQLVAEDAQHYFILYPNLTYTQVVTGRFSAKKPNVLAIPKHSALGKQLRKYFIARPGNVLLSSDLSQIELRLAAHLSQDPRLLAEYRDGIDKHQATVDHVLKMPGNTDEAVRRIAKNLNFAVLMGTTEYGFHDQLHEQGIFWTIDQCAGAIHAWYETYHWVKEFNARQHHHCEQHGFVVAPLSGRRRYLGSVHSTVPYIREAALREAQAFAFSTDAQYVMQVWMGRIWRKSLLPRQGTVYAEPWLQVHDDMLIETAADEAVSLAGEMKACLPQLLDVPTTTDTKSGINWGELAPLKE